MDAALLLLADSRLPAGGHAHSGGLEPAATAGTVRDLATLADFLRGRLATTGLVAAGLAAAACARAGEPRGRSVPGGWAALDAEADARTPSPAQRRASRAQGRALLRAARAAWPHPVLEAVAAGSSGQGSSGAGAGLDVSGRNGSSLDGSGGGGHNLAGSGRAGPGGGGGPHHPVVLGAATAVAGGTPEQAAEVAAYGSVTGPASAAVRLLGLDPLGVHRVLADLAGRIDAVAAEAAETVRAGDLPAASAPALDLLAELHQQADLRLFES